MCLSFIHTLVVEEKLRIINLNRVEYVINWIQRIIKAYESGFIFRTIRIEFSIRLKVYYFSF